MKFPIPEHGDTKVKRRFAFLPVVIGDVWIWLERYEEVFRYERFFTSDAGFWRHSGYRRLDV